jgi:hypothetical protein
MKTKILVSSLLVIVLALINGCVEETSKKIVRHEADLIISGSEIFEIKNVIYEVYGKLTVEDTAKLIIDNADVRIEDKPTIQKR